MYSYWALVFIQGYLSVSHDNEYLSNDPACVDEDIEDGDVRGDDQRGEDHENALSHRPETCSAREMTAPSSARPFQYSSSQMSAREDSWVVNGVSTTGTRWSCSWF